jgi:hypothetical protein
MKETELKQLHTKLLNHLCQYVESAQDDAPSSAAIYPLFPKAFLYQVHLMTLCMFTMGTQRRQVIATLNIGVCLFCLFF